MPERFYWFTMLRPADLKWFECEFDAAAAALLELSEAREEELSELARLCCCWWLLLLLCGRMRRLRARSEGVVPFWVPGKARFYMIFW